MKKSCDPSKISSEPERGSLKYPGYGTEGSINRITVHSQCPNISRLAMNYLAGRFQKDSIHPSLPVVVYGLCAIVSGVSILLLPETAGKPLPETVADVFSPSSRSVGRVFPLKIEWF